MTEVEERTPRRVREEVTDGAVVEKLFKISSSDLKTVLRDWEKIKKNFKDVAIKVFQNYFNDHPEYKSLFPSFAEVEEEELEYNEDFRIHSYAVLNGIGSVMMNLSAVYEEDNEILPVIAFTHKSRGITAMMMTGLKESLHDVFCDFLKADRKESASWNSLLDFIFDEYLGIAEWDDKKEFTDVPASNTLN